MRHCNGKSKQSSRFFCYFCIFRRYPLPMKVLCERGAILRLSVWDSDYGLKHDDFIGECFVHLQPSSNTMTGKLYLTRLTSFTIVLHLKKIIFLHSGFFSFEQHSIDTIIICDAMDNCIYRYQEVIFSV